MRKSREVAQSRPKPIDPSQFYTALDLATLGLWPEPTLRSWRCRAEAGDPLRGPRFTRLGRRVVYRGADVLDALGGPGGEALRQEAAESGR